MQAEPENAIAGVCRQVTIEGPAKYVVAGRVVDVQSSGTAVPAAAALVASLQATLYSELYCGTPHGVALPASAAVGDLVDTLSRANTTVARLETGWFIQGAADPTSGRAVATNGRQTRPLEPGHFVAQVPGAPAVHGMPILIHVPRESIVLQPGFYFALGQAASEPEAAGCLVRIYFNIEPDGAATLVEKTTLTLNALQIPFQLKVAHTRAYFQRRDPAVLFIEKRFFRFVRAALSQVVPALRPFVRAGVPLFTRRLDEGVALAEDPENGESFGMHRSRLVAEGLGEAFARGAPAVEAVEARFRREGLDPTRPHLARRSRDIYADDSSVWPSGELLTAAAS
jgi:hypothetical protein